MNLFGIFCNFIFIKLEIRNNLVLGRITVISIFFGLFSKAALTMIDWCFFTIVVLCLSRLGSFGVYRRPTVTQIRFTFTQAKFGQKVLLWNNGTQKWFTGAQLDSNKYFGGSLRTKIYSGSLGLTRYSKWFTEALLDSKQFIRALKDFKGYSEGFTGAYCY